LGRRARVQSDDHHVQANLPAAKTTTRNRNIESNSVTLSDSPHKERGGKRAAGSARRVPRQVVGERRAEVTAGTEPQPSMKMAVENWRAA
jgi:predicted double-glycine peptidase